MTIRVVPPHPSVAEPGLIEQATAGGQMTYRGGPLLANVSLSAVFLGDWVAADMQPIEDYLRVVVAGVYLDGLKEYNVGHGSFNVSVNLPWAAGPPPPPPPPGCLPTFGLAKLFAPKLLPRHSAPTTIDDSEIQARLNAGIADGTLPAKTPQSLYMTFVQPGVTVTLQGDASCSTFCGYHDSDGSGLYYGVIPYPGCLGCTGTLSTFQALTSVTSHELAEAVTDPVPGFGWYNDSSGEVGDPCAWQTYTLDGYTVQREWLNSHNGCA